MFSLGFSAFMDCNLFSPQNLREPWKKKVFELLKEKGRSPGTAAKEGTREGQLEIVCQEVELSSLGKWEASMAGPLQYRVPDS